MTWLSLTDAVAMILEYSGGYQILCAKCDRRYKEAGIMQMLEISLAQEAAGIPFIPVEELQTGPFDKTCPSDI